MEAGKQLTPSVHNYIIFTISTAPIQIPTKTRPSFPNANWELYKEILAQHQPILPDMTIEEIDTNTELWTKRIVEAGKQSIPLISYRTLPHYRTSQQTRLLQIQYDALKHDIETLGCSYDKYQGLVKLHNISGQI